MNYLNRIKYCGQFLKKFSDSTHKYKHCSLETSPAKEILSSAHFHKIFPVHLPVSHAWGCSQNGAYAFLTRMIFYFKVVNICWTSFGSAIGCFILTAIVITSSSAPNESNLSMIVCSLSAYQLQKKEICFPCKHLNHSSFFMKRVLWVIHSIDSHIICSTFYSLQKFFFFSSEW